MKVAARLLALLAVLASCESGDDPVSPTLSTMAVVRVVNARTDTIHSVVRWSCAADSTVSQNFLAAGGRILPNGRFEAVVAPGCHRLDFQNGAGAVIDSRVNLQLQARDTVVLRLVQ